MKVALVRGSYLNMFEGQNYELIQGLAELTGIAAYSAIHRRFPFPIRRLFSPADIGMPRWLANRTIGDRQLLWGLADAVHDADIVHTADPHYFYSYQLACLRKRRFIRCLISTSWETIPFNNESTTAKRRIKYFTQRSVDHFICHTQRAKDALVAEGVVPKKITVIRLGVDVDRFHPAPRRARRVLRILSAGRQVREKGIDDLKQLHDRLRSVEFVRESGVSYEQMPQLYRTADLFIHLSKTTPTWEEQYGMVLIEAMASGLPIIAYRSGAVAEVLGDGGVLVPEGDLTAVENEITRLAKHPHLRSEQSARARKRAVALFDRSQFARRLLRLYQKKRYTS